MSPAPKTQVLGIDQSRNQNVRFQSGELVEKSALNKFWQFLHENSNRLKAYHHEKRDRKLISVLVATNIVFSRAFEPNSSNQSLEI